MNDHSESPVLHERDGAVETWTLNRPETRNAITDEETIVALEDGCAPRTPITTFGS